MQRLADFSALILPLLGSTWNCLYCGLAGDGERLPRLTGRHRRAFERCDARFDYGDLMLELGGALGTRDLTFTLDSYQDGLGSPPVAALRVAPESIPARWANLTDELPYLRPRVRCNLFLLGWNSPYCDEGQGPLVLTGAWAVPDEVPTLDGPEPCLGAVALQFDRLNPPEAIPTPGTVPPWLEPGPFDRALDRLDSILGSNPRNLPPRNTTRFLGMTYSIREDASVGYFFQDRLPKGLAWDRVAGFAPPKNPGADRG